MTTPAQSSAVGSSPAGAVPVRSMPAAVVKPHPAGGWTHAVISTGAARIYRGNWPTKRAAARALTA